MDEADKYKQRLEAIAEKRRLQEEQDRARREMEDEKLRLQQLKRKSLRDQWLMEGPPLSPASPDAQSPRSPLWGFHAQEIEKRIDKLQSESQRLAEEEEKLKEQMEEGQTEALKVAEGEAEKVQVTAIQNGENKATGIVTTEDEVKTKECPVVDETAAVLTNGGGDLEADTSLDASEQSNPSSINGQVGATEDAICMKLEQGLHLDVSEAEPGQVSNADINEGEEEEGTLVMRAECVIITDEGDDVPVDLTPEEDQHETIQSEETPLLNPEAGQERGEAVEDEVKTEVAPETLTQPERSEATEPTVEAQPATADVDMQGSQKINENEDKEAKSEEEDKQSEDQNSVQSQSNALEGTIVASLPVYSQSAFTPELEAEDAAATSPEEAEAASEAQSPATLPGQFQEVPLADPKENQRTEAELGEQEPLLMQAKAPDTHAEQATANNPTMTETQSLNGAGQGEEIKAPKRKTCQCCSVM